MPLPIDLVLVRHGQSEANYAKRLSEEGDHEAMKKLLGRHTASYRLTDIGREQAAKTGQYIRERFGKFDRYFTSEYVRALETAACLDLPDAEWKADFYMTERAWGDLDSLHEDERREKFATELDRQDIEPFFWKPPNGESLAEVCLRVDRILNTLARECSDKRVIIVCHGEVMWAFRIRLEQMSQIRFKELYLANRLRQDEVRIKNCQILHYMRRYPASASLSRHYEHFQAIRPAEEQVIEFPVASIKRPRYSNEELHKIVGTFSQLLQ